MRRSAVKIQMQRENESRPNNGYKARRTEGTRNQEHRDATQNRGYKKSSKSYQDSNGSGGANRKFQKKNASGYSANRYQKDKENDYENRRNNDSKKRMSANTKDKAKEQQPDKMDIVKRLEKEKKAMQKKKQDSKKNRMQSAKPQMRAKRTNNIDWTKEYENDSYDDDDMSYYY